LLVLFDYTFLTVSNCNGDFNNYVWYPYMLSNKECSDIKIYLHLVYNNTVHGNIYGWECRLIVEKRQTITYSFLWSLDSRLTNISLSRQFALEVLHSVDSALMCWRLAANAIIISRSWLISSKTTQE